MTEARALAAASAAPAVEAVAVEGEEGLRGWVSRLETLEPVVREGEGVWAASRPQGVVWGGD